MPLTDIENQVDERALTAFEESDLNKPIGEKEIKAASEILQRYKAGKANLDRRIVEDEEWWELRHWPFIRGNQRTVKNEETGEREIFPGPEPASAWLFNAILNKHADAMDNYPEPTVLPRERSDEPAAKTLSSVLPVIMQYNDFEKTYWDNWWEKLKHGTAAYGVFWNPDKDNGLGDIDIRSVDLLKVFWEPGVTDIQQSRNLFIVELMDHDLLNKQYPQYHGKISGAPVDITQYIYNDTVDTTDKDLVVDWYYKIRVGSKTILHYCKFRGDTLLYASENDPAYRERGYYDHGKYPIVMDILFPEKGTPAGFGYVAICKSPQMYIDKLDANILESSMMATKKRFFVSSSTNINTDDFMDWNKPLVEVEGELSDGRLQEITTQPLGSQYENTIARKVEEMKDTASNRDVNSGGSAGSGVTAASAIAALQEAGNKTSRDMIAASYRAQTEIAKLIVELIRQFYDEARSFRITAPNGYDFTELSNGPMQNQPMLAPNGMPMMNPQGEIMMRRPIFDLKISAQRKNPFSRMEQNERAKELYSMGFFNPEMAQQTMIALDMMDFEGIDKIREKVAQGQTLLNIVQQQQQQIAQLAGLLTGGAVTPVGSPGQPSQGNPQVAPKSGSESIASGIMDSRAPQAPYAQRLVNRSTPKVEGE